MGKDIHLLHRFRISHKLHLFVADVLDVLGDVLGVGAPVEADHGHGRA